MNRVNKLSFFILIHLLISCDKMEYSPHVKYDRNTAVNLNKSNIEKILNKPNIDGKVRIAFIGDSQNYYDEASPLVEKINGLADVDFVIHAGDITEFSLLQEYEWMDKIFSGLNVPYVAVIGNHDALANGEEIYKRMYGPTDFTFVYDSIKFIFHNTNSREYNYRGNIPDLEFLRRECVPEENVRHVITVSHIPPFNQSFDKKLEADYTSILAECRNFLVSLHGHLHSIQDQTPYNDGVRYICCNSVNKRSFLLFEIADGKVEKRIIDY